MIAVNELTEGDLREAERCLCLICRKYLITKEELLLPIFRNDFIHQIKGLYITYMIQKNHFSYACLSRVLLRDKRTIRYSYKKYSYYVEKMLLDEYNELIEYLK